MRTIDLAAIAADVTADHRDLDGKRALIDGLTSQFTDRSGTALMAPWPWEITERHSAVDRRVVLASPATYEPRLPALLPAAKHAGRIQTCAVGEIIGLGFWFILVTMSSYTGPAVLVADGVLISVDLDVRTYESIVGAHVRRSWSGTACVTDGNSLRSQVGQTVTLEFPDGVEGRAVVGSVGGSPAEEIIAVRGVGEPPY